MKDIFKGSGEVEELDERLMNEVIALTGSSPAYVFMMIEAMADGAVQQGIPRKAAYRLAAQTVLGSARWCWKQACIRLNERPGLFACRHYDRGC